MRKSRAAWEREPALRIASSSSIFPGPTCACLAKSIRTCGARLSMARLSGALEELLVAKSTLAERQNGEGADHNQTNLCGLEHDVVDQPSAVSLRASVLGCLTTETLVMPSMEAS